jgi:uncharacterized iron-regulated membrane protein
MSIPMDILTDQQVNNVEDALRNVAGVSKFKQATAAKRNSPSAASMPRNRSTRTARGGEGASDTVTARYHKEIAAGSLASDDGANRRWSAYANPYTGALVWHGPDQSLFRPWLLRLHEYLHVGKIEYAIVSLAAVALTLLGLTGIWITRDRFRALLRHPFRLHLGRRVAFSDLHKWIGLCSLYFTLVLGATGVWFTWNAVPDLLTAKPHKPLAPAFDLTTLTPITPALAVVRTTFPDAEIARIIFP